MKKTILFCGGAVLFAALLELLGVTAVQLFAGMDLKTIALGVMIVAAPLMLLFIHFSLGGGKHNNHRHHKGA